MKFKDLVIQNRSFRRFDRSVKLDKAQLSEWVDHARLSPNSSNAQSLLFYLVWEEEEAAKIFDTVTFAAYLRDWSGPAEDERPVAYIIILGDNGIKADHDIDCGIAAQSIALAASVAGYGCLMMGSFKRKSLARVLELPEHLDLLLVMAFGKPAETVVIEDLEQVQGIQYWRDAEGVHHVPKRSLEALTLWKGRL